MGLGDTSITWRVAFFLQILGFIFMLAGVCSTYMSAAEPIPNKERHIGFWDMCDDTQTFGCKDMITYVNSLDRENDWVYGCRALIVIGLIIEATTIVLSLWLSYSIASVNNKIGNLISGVCGLISVLFSLIGAIVFMQMSKDLLEDTLEMDADPSWSFAVIITAQALFFIAGIMLIWKACRAS